MRSAAGFPVLLLCLSWTWAQGDSGGVTGNDVTQTVGEIHKKDVPFEMQGIEASRNQSDGRTNIIPDIWAELKELRDMVIEQKVELRNSQIEIEKLEQENADLKARMSTSENQVEELMRENADIVADK